jgi:hypothetical protein
MFNQAIAVQVVSSIIPVTEQLELNFLTILILLSIFVQTEFIVIFVLVKRIPLIMFILMENFLLRVTTNLLFTANICSVFQFEAFQVFVPLRTESK